MQNVPTDAAKDHPRLRGEQIYPTPAIPARGGSPPLARGTVNHNTQPPRCQRITPACAGNSIHLLIPFYTFRDHPRLRGEQNAASFDTLGSPGSPPLARGTDSGRPCRPDPRGITPACAGNRRSSHLHPWQFGDHPRLRGEQFRFVYLLPVQIGSPPLARGTDKAMPNVRTRFRITPACAGNRWQLPHIEGGDEDHPRLRGEQSTSWLALTLKRGSPPLARGTVSGENLGKLNGGITPACAGNSSFFNRSCCSSWDHPRLRGEQASISKRLFSHSGSPPLARGTVVYVRLCLENRGITPACAGNS